MLKRKVVWDNPEKATTPLPTNIPVISVYFFPNRPTLMPPSEQLLNSLEASGKYVAERKWNGDNTLYNSSTLKFWNRHKEIHRYAPSPEVKEELAQFPKGCVINAELVNYRTKTVKELIVVHSIMIYQGKPLIGKTWGDARKIIEGFKYGSHVVLSETFKSGFWELFQKADGTIVEGIILKDPTGKLQFSTTPLLDVGWMKKFRKPRAGVYSF